MSDANKPLTKQDQKRLNEKRGEGIGKDYIPFIKVGEFSSSGESIRVKGFKARRLHHFHSGNELAAFLVFDWCRDVIDIREQFPIPLSDSLNICKQLGIKHPQVKGELIIVTTDLLVDFIGGKQLAIPIKPADKLDQLRILEKLQIEKTYWESAGVECLIFTEKDISADLKMNLKWLTPILNIDNQNIDSFSEQDVLNLVSRIAKQPTLYAARYCAQLDDEYQVDPGYHVSLLRFAIAQHYLKTSLFTPFHSWRCQDIEVMSVNRLDFEVYNAS
jgi:hypothetical protein